MRDSIPISPQHGLNPAIPKCYYCQKDKNEVVLAGRIDRRVPNRHGIDQREVDIRAPQGAVWDMRPCDACKEIMAEHVILISIRDTEEPPPPGSDAIWNPWRTGGFAVVKEATIRRVFSPPSLVESILRHRYSFIADSAWVMLGLPQPVGMPPVAEEQVKG